MNSFPTLQRFNASTIQRLFLFTLWTFRLPRFNALTLLTFSLLSSSHAATVVGDLKDISIQALDTKILFTPTTNVLLTTSGLSAGPPRMIDSLSGAFTIALEAGDYTVSLPLILYRAPFKISVPVSGSTINITNLLSPPTTYTYTNYLATAPVKVNAARVTAWSTNSASTLLDSAATLPAGVLAARSVIVIEAFGSIADPGANGPNTTFALKLGSTALCTQSKSCVTGSWHLQALITVRSPGVSGSVVASMAMIEDSGNFFPFDSIVTTINTTGSLTVDLTAALDDYTGTESVICEQLLITLR